MEAKQPVAGINVFRRANEVDGEMPVAQLARNGLGDLADQTYFCRLRISDARWSLYGHLLRAYAGTRWEFV